MIPLLVLCLLALALIGAAVIVLWPEPRTVIRMTTQADLRHQFLMIGDDVVWVAHQEGTTLTVRRSGKG